MESLYSDSPYLLCLSILALVLSFYFPVMLGNKMTVHHIPKPLKKLVSVNILWNVCSILGILLYSGKMDVHSAAYIPRQILFGIQALLWVRVGLISVQVGELFLFKKHRVFRTIISVLGSVAVVVATIILCTKPETLHGISVLGHHPFAHAPIFFSFTAIYIVFTLTSFVAAIYLLFSGTQQTVDATLAQTGNYMAGTYASFVGLAFAFDIIIPVVYKLWEGPFHFLIWNQFLCIMFTLLCGQYFTSVSFKNKSSYWFLNKLISKLEDGIIYYDDAGRIMYINQGGAKLLGMTSSNLIGQSIRSIFPPNLNYFKEIVYNNIRMDINGEIHSFKIHFFKNHQTLTTILNIAYFTDQSKTLLLQQHLKTLNEQYVEYNHDLVRFQNRLNKEASIKAEKENALNTLINALPFRVWYKNELGAYQKQNQLDLEHHGSLEGITDNPEKQTTYEINARENGEVSGYTSFEDKDKNEISQDEANRLLKEGAPVETFETMFIPILQGQAPYKTLCIQMNVTEQRRLEQERNMLREQKFIHSRLEELGTMCGAFAHDYNNILGSQIGFCQLAQEMLPPDHQAYMFISEALKAAQRGKTSLEELLNAIRGNANAATPAMVFSPYIIIEDVVKKISLTLPPNVTVHSDHLDKNLKIKGIVASLDRIISNMANNALFAMKGTGGTLTFQLSAVQLKEQLVTPYAPPIPPGQYAKIDISDTGSGMDSNTLERIFAPFFTTKAPGEGLGLGLSSALRLLKEGNAYFTVNTTLGEGTSFNLYWPLETELKEESCQPS